MTKQYITRKYEMDFAHRVMNERVKCSHNHGHRGQCDITLSFNNCAEIGYIIDFKEMKRVFCSFCDEYFDHGSILNSHDHILIEALKKIKACGKDVQWVKIKCGRRGEVK